MQKLIKLAQEGKINHNATIMDSQAILINAKIEDVWNALLDSESWPNWQPAVDEVSTEGDEVGCKIEWKSKNTKIHSTIAVCEPMHVFGWVSKIYWFKSIHLFKLEKVGENQTSVTTEESMQGLVLFLLYNHQNLNKNLMVWLRSLKERAEIHRTDFMPIQ